MLTRSLERPDGVRNAGALLCTRSSTPRRTPQRCSRGCGSFTVRRTRATRTSALDLNALVEQAVALTRPRWHGQALGQGVTVDLRTELAPGLPELVADAAELREMFTNLIFNAVDAHPRRRAAR